MNPSVADSLRGRLRASLRTAMVARDSAAVSALRSLIAAIDNAEAVAVGRPPKPELSRFVAGGAVGLGAGEAPRRVLSQEDLDDLVRGEIAERRQQAAKYQAAGHPDRAHRLRAEADALEPYVR